MVGLKKEVWENLFSHTSLLFLMKRDSEGNSLTYKATIPIFQSPGILELWPYILGAIRLPNHSNF